jgi:hypothetical protein
MKLKQAIIVRTDLGMGKGKIAGQVAHAAVRAAESIRRYCPDWYYSWLEDEDAIQTKIILKVDSEAKLQLFYHATLLLRELTRQKYMMPVRRSWNLVRLQQLASDQPQSTSLIR